MSVSVFATDSKTVEEPLSLPSRSMDLFHSDRLNIENIEPDYELAGLTQYFFMNGRCDVIHRPKQKPNKYEDCL